MFLIFCLASGKDQGRYVDGRGTGAWCGDARGRPDKATCCIIRVHYLHYLHYSLPEDPSSLTDLSGDSCLSQPLYLLITSRTWSKTGRIQPRSPTANCVKQDSGLQDTKLP